MVRSRVALLVVIAGGVFSAWPAPVDVFEADVKPFLKSNCVVCHSGSNAPAGLDLSLYLTVDAKSAFDRERWERIGQKLASGEMPPQGMPRPAEDRIAAVRNWIETQSALAERMAKPTPGRVTARRLNRYEYNHTVLDLLGINYQPADDFPPDDSGYGFDSIGDVLSVSPALMQKYFKAAETISKLVVPAEQPSVKSTVDRYLAERLGQYPRMKEEFTHQFPADGEYNFRTTWYQKLPDGLQIEGTFLLDGRPVASTKVTCTEEMDRAFAARIPVSRGPHRLTAAIKILDPAYKKAMPYLEYTEVQGPVSQRSLGVTDAYRKLFICNHPPGQHLPSCERRILNSVAERAWRRPVTMEETAALQQLAAASRKRGDSFEQSIGVAVQAVLTSPWFLFRIEKDSGAGNAYRLNSWELASRLSYFLWSSIPDEKLRLSASQGKLRDQAMIRAEVKRMLADPKADRLVEAFGGQWLQIRNLDTQKPDARAFPAYDQDLRDDMKTETLMFLQSIVKEDRSVLDLIDGRFTFLNARLANYYGVKGVTGDEFRRVELDGVQRSGILTQASVLTVSSYPTRTSPVIRGKYILENILGTPPPPPPPDVPALEQSSAGPGATVRQQLEKHRANAVCASCHSKMDPLGFGLENYDAVGHWRDKDGALTVDSTGILPDGRTFSTPAELKSILKSEPNVFVECLVRKLLVFALGRGLESYDRPAVKQITENVAASGYRFSTVIEQIALSLPFDQRSRALSAATPASRTQLTAQHK